MPKLSVVIATHRRADILGLCLNHLQAQTIADELEVIVVSDGHDDDTTALFAQPRWQLIVRFLEIEKSQQGNARNAGVQIASAQRCLFINDDILLAPDACEIHLRTPTPAAVLGYTTWDPAAGITPVMRWLETSGWQFGYPMIAPYAHRALPEEIQHRFTYTSHISLPTLSAKAHPFRTDVRLYGWEDVEWGMRLQRAGIPLVYEPDAKALHHHHLTLEQSLERMRTLGRSAVVIKQNVSDFDRVPRGAKLWAYRLLALLPTLDGAHRKAFLEGLAAAN